MEAIAVLTELSSSALLRLLQLASPALPVGAFSYSEGLETLSATDQLPDVIALAHWLQQELQCGAVRLEAAVMVRAYQAVGANDASALMSWNAWLSAARETEELRQQSWQMGYSLSRLLQEVEPTLQPTLATVGQPCNFAIAFGIAAAAWQIPVAAATLGYLQSWATNLVNAGVKLIPLGQTAGQQLLLKLQPNLEQAAQAALTLADDQLASVGWGLAIASMNHEVQYSRLFRS